MSGVLADLKVTAFTHYAAGPLAAQFIGALGADVIKIEAPGSDLNRHLVRDRDGRFGGISPYFVTLNRNQRTIAIDLKSEAGKAIAQRLIARSDLVIENYRPGVLDRLGFGYEDLREQHPGLIYCSISGFDLMGPSRHAPGQDLIIQAVSGLATLTGSSSSPPVAVGAYAIDAYTSMQCVAGILAALRHRDRSGEGQWVRADMMSSALHLMAHEASYALNVDPELKRSSAGVAHVNQAAPYAIYGTTDGALAIGLATPDKVSVLAEKLGVLGKLEQWMSERGLWDHRDEVVAALAEALRTRSTEEGRAMAAAAGIMSSPVRTLAQALEDPATVASGLVRDANSAYAGPHRVVVEPLSLSRTPLEFTRPAPGFGEQSREILLELGFDQSEVAALIEAGAVLETAAP